MPAVGQPAHEQATEDAAGQDQRQDAGHVALPVLLVETQIQLQVLHRATHGADGAHAADEEQVERGRAQHLAEGCGGGACRLVGGKRRRRVLDDPRQRPRDRDHQAAEHLHGAVPAEVHGQPVGEARHHRAADADADVGKAHGLAARRGEPAREQHLHRQRAPEDIAERVEDVAEIEARECRDVPEPDHRATRHEDADQQQAARAVAVDQVAGQIAEQRTDEQLAVGVARRDLLPRPAIVLDEEVVEERQPVQADADGGKERGKGGRCCRDLPAARDLVRAGRLVWRTHASAFTAFSRA